MEINKTPKTFTGKNETKCCPKFNFTEWDGKEIVFKEKLFAKANTFNLFHIPMNMGGVMKKSWKAITDAGADGATDEFLLLSHDPSLWKGEHYFSVTKEVPGLEMAKLSGTYITKVFEGPYKNAGKWVKEMEEFTKEKSKELKKLYFFYTTCPKCAKHYGKNYVVGFAQI